MKTPQQMLDAHRDDQSVRDIDWEMDGLISIAERVLALEGISDPTVGQIDALTDILLDEADRGLWPIEDPDMERRLQVGARALALLHEKAPDEEDGNPTIH